MRIKESRRGMKVGDATDKEILRRQMELLAENSTDPGYAANNTYAMLKLYKQISEPRLFLIRLMLLYSIISIFVSVIKFFRRNT